MKKWEHIAHAEVVRATLNPDARPRYRVPARRWWQLWKPKWKWVDGISYNQIQRAYGLPTDHTTKDDE